MARCRVEVVKYLDDKGDKGDKEESECVRFSLEDSAMDGGGLD